MAESFPLYAELWAALFRREDQRLLRAADHLQQAEGEVRMRAALHMAHLFLGFPLVIRALNLLPAATTTEKAPQTNSGEQEGEAVFREVYGADAMPVLQHLRRLDGGFTSLVLRHAYGGVFGHSPLPLPLRERLSVLALADSGCEMQAKSHLRACLRHGVCKETLLADCLAVDWLPQTVQEQLQGWIRHEVVPDS